MKFSKQNKEVRNKYGWLCLGLFFGGGGCSGIVVRLKWGRNFMSHVLIFLVPVVLRVENADKSLTSRYHGLLQQTLST